MFFFNDTNIYIRVLNRFGFSYLSMQSGLGWALYIISSYHFLDLGSMVNRTWDHSSSTTSLIYWTSKFSAPKKKKKKNGSSISFPCLFFTALYIPSLCSHLFFEKYLLWVFLIQKWVFAHRKSWKKNFKLFDIFPPPLFHLFSYENRGKKKKEMSCRVNVHLARPCGSARGEGTQKQKKRSSHLLLLVHLR